MPIEALPQATVRAIGSTSVISDPCSVVKELIDNALDAGASSLFIEISSNTVDVIQLKDNGHGIPTEDHPNVCRHTFTSKIRTAEDLKNVGGSSFGFRGEALASIAEMSGGITVTTHVASSVTGSCVKYQRDGELLQSTLISHPVGTTVRVVDFLKHIPVRKQVVLKSATKILTKVKKLLHSYAIAQPSKRLSLKVLKAKNENNNWVYAPASDATLSDAAVKVFGRDLSSSCIFKTMSSKSLEAQVDEGEYKLSCLLPKPDSDLAKVSNSGQFLSVDGRPLSTATGIGQDIGKRFKSYIRTVALRNEATKSITDPFLCLQLSCPQGSYDVNIEPSKDDVLFEDRDIVFSLIEAFFEEHYGQLADSRKGPVKKKNPKTSQANGDFNLLLSRARPSDSSEESVNTEEHPSEPIATISTIQATPRSQYSLGTSTPGLLRRDNTNDVVHVTASQISASINPWSVSRKGSTWRTPRRESNTQAINLATSSCESTPGNVGGLSQSNGSQQSPESPGFPSPPISRITSTSPIHRRKQISSSQLSLEPTDSIRSAQKAARQRDKERYGSGALDTWFTRTTQAYMMQESANPVQDQHDAEPTLSQLAEQRFGRGSQTAPEVTANANATQSGESSLEGQTHLSRLDDDTIDEVEYEGSMDSGRGFPVLERWAASLREGFNPDTQSELEKALDFEKRKKEAMQRHRNRTVTHSVPFSSQAITAVSHSPHHNRFLKAKAALASEGSFAVEAIPKNAFSPKDPRAYLIRCSSGDEASTDSTKSRRAHTRRLPFERIPDGQDVHDLSLTISTDSLNTRESFGMTNFYDSYTRDGSIRCAFASSDVESLAPFWNERLRTMIKQKYKEIDGSQAHELMFDTSSLITNHLKELPEAS
ncbi:DNA mismatch repair protein C-terminal [Penicillium malachiteum]|uniref:DNA mismatch repair protein C-terminal n=1 Tax=Penicillium malachiteum TaxID=1324776 RepID=UPI002547147B|nr:DNA mismatch repair protein C-terminal [Penicillium malachiteum]KAJ5731562.1 DNA mismatch repair protein C-terminal [Penicillium malachiteum]